MAKDKEAAIIDRDMTTITASRVFANKVRAIADRRGLTMSDVLEQYATGIGREYRKVLEEMHRDLGGNGGA